MRARLLTTVATAYAPASWGTTYIITTELLPAHRPLLAGVMRALPSGLILLATARELPRGAWWWKATVLGTVNVGALFAFLFVSAERLPGGVASIVSAVGPLIVATLSWPLLGLRPTARVILAGAIGVTGVALLVLTPKASLDPIGLLASLGGTSVFALGTVLTRRWGRPVPLATFTAWQLTVGGLLLLPLMLAVEGTPHALDGDAIGGFTYLALANTALAYILWFRGIERLSATAVSFLTLLSPIVATLIGLAVLDQTLTPLQITGMLLAATGLLSGQLSSPRPDQAGHTRRAIPTTEPGPLGTEPG
jgi:probable blue pigment (indigoidine) exporter